MEKVTVDCRGMQCPAPILQIAKAARLAASGPALLEVLADDDDFPADLKAWCRTTKSALHSLTNDGGVHRALLGLNGASLPTLGPQASPDPGLLRSPAATSGPPSSTPAPGSGPPSSVTHASRQLAAGPASSAPAKALPSPDIVDLSGLRAPEPVLQLSRIVLEGSRPRLTVRCDDPSFMGDLVAWASSMKVVVTSMRQEGAVVLAELSLPGVSARATPAVSAREDLRLPVVVPGRVTEPSTALVPVSAPRGEIEAAPRHNRATILVYHNDFEALMAALLVSTTSAAQGMEVVVFFSFWGVNLLRGEEPRAGVERPPVSFLQRIMKWMMPKGPRRQKMGKMHMGGMGKGMMEHFMRRNNVMSLTELMSVAVEQRIRFVVCTMSMGIMGIQKSDIMDLPNIEFGGVTLFVEQSRSASMSLVF